MPTDPNALNFMILVHEIANRLPPTGQVYPHITVNERTAFLALRKLGYPGKKTTEICWHLRDLGISFEKFTEEYLAVLAMFQVAVGAGNKSNAMNTGGDDEQPLLEMGGATPRKPEVR